MRVVAQIAIEGTPKKAGPAMARCLAAALLKEALRDKELRQDLLIG